MYLQFGLTLPFCPFSAAVLRSSTHRRRRSVEETEKRMAGVDLTESFIVVGAKPRPANFADAHIDTDQSAAEIARLRERPLPTSPDGYYRPQSKAAGDANGKDEEHSRLYNLVDGLQQAVKRGPPVTDPKALDAIVDALINKDAVDDRKGFVRSLFS